MRRALAMAAAVIGLLFALPAQAGLRVTMIAEDVTQHELFLRLSNQQGVIFRGAEGEGTIGFAQPGGAKKATFRWKDATLGRVIRDVCASYSVVASSYGAGQFGFRPGKIPTRQETTKDGIGFSIGDISQSDMLTIEPGTGERTAQRLLNVQLIYRALDGDGDIFAGVKRLAVTDEAGKRHEQQVPDYSYLQFGLPDEDSRSIGMPWPSTPAKRLKSIEGELSLYTDARDYRYAAEIADVQAPKEEQLGPVRVKVQRLAVQQNSLEVALELNWGPETEVNLYGRNAVRATALVNGNRFQLPYRSFKTTAGEGGRKTAAVEYTGDFAGAPTSFELIVPTRSGPLRKVEFRIQNVLMPFGRPYAFRTTPLAMKPQPTLAPVTDSSRKGGPYYDAQGGTLVLPPYPTTPSGKRPAVGLSRRQPDGAWSAVRWIQLPAKGDAPRITLLEPGEYQVRLRDFPAGPAPRPRGLSTDPVFEVSLKRGSETKL